MVFKRGEYTFGVKYNSRTIGFLASIASQRITHDFLVITSIIINLEDWFSTVFLTSKLILDFEKNTEKNQMGGRRIQQEVTIVLAW